MTVRRSLLSIVVSLFVYGSAYACLPVLTGASSGYRFLQGGLAALTAVVVGELIKRASPAPFQSTWFHPLVLHMSLVLAVPTPVTWISGQSVSLSTALTGGIGAYLVELLYNATMEPSSETRGGTSRTRVLLVGAGEAGEMVLREITNHPDLNRTVVGFVDDDPDKLNGVVGPGIPVLGGTDQVAELCQQHDVDEVIIAMPSAPGSVIRSVTRQADRMNAELRIVPGIREIIEGDVHWNQIRNVQPEDLLGRETVEIEMNRLEKFLTGKNVVVTGAAGSIGSHLVREVLQHSVNKVLGIDINESDLYELQASGLEPKFRDHFHTALGDVREADTIRDIFREFQPDLVLHAAALKHVPMSERHPSEVIKTNLRGTINVLDAAADTDAGDCLVISTDKAVEPDNLMGMSKRLNELLIPRYQQQHADTRFCAVRFGNVLGSRGSVVPLFKKQIQRGGPVTVTDPEVQRYFMTPVEAVKLVLTAASFDEDGALYVLDLGDPIRILDLARQLISLSGYEPETEIPITFTGLREGETMEEQLIAEDERPSETSHEQIRRIHPPELSPRQFEQLQQLIDQPHTDAERAMDRMTKIVQ